ncbi:MAG: DUF2156 domain-containing protein [Lachnospiraceae bacterium]|jgi:phosphatidylglycerol lysyltransferase|nr:DUF2156 domain-containing protein [Lachnospiraceae bacterium]
MDQEDRLKEKERVLLLLRKYAVNSISYLDLEEDKSWFFSSGTEGAAAYAMSGRDMVICGDPVCAPEEIGSFLKELMLYAKKNHYRLIFLFVMEDFLDVYRANGFYVYKSGEEAVFDLSLYQMSGKKAAKVRASVHQARRDGLTVHEYCPERQRDPSIEKNFQEITAAWLSRKHTGMLQFAVGSLDLDYPADKRYFYTVDRENVMQGFMVFNPYRHGHGYIADITRRRPGSSHGVLELIFCDAVEKFKSEGIQWGSLGVAPLLHTNVPGCSNFEKLEHFNYEKMDRIYDFKALYAAKAKFAPTSWENVYIASYPKHMTLAMDYSAANVVNSKGIQDFWNTFCRYYLKHQHI